MKLLIDVDKKLVCEGFERQFTEEEKDTLIRAIGKGTPYNEGVNAGHISDILVKAYVSGLLTICGGMFDKKDVDECYSALMEAFKMLKTNTLNDGYNTETKNDIENGKTLNPKVKQGEWIIIDDTEKFIAKCSVCGRIEDSRMVKDYPFCRCGAKMTGGA